MRPILLSFFLLSVSGWAQPADQPVSRTDQNSLTAHEQLLEKAKKGGIDIYFEGDSITRRWGALDYPELLANWTQNFFGWNAADLDGAPTKLKTSYGASITASWTGLIQK